MTENNLLFPDHVETAKFGIGKDIREVISTDNGGHFNNPSDSHMYLTPEEQAAGVRLKRRRRCGQCGPCQVKENCNKCHYCVRKDVLKQTCVYRKCVYLRSKPKPYMRNAQDSVPFTSRSLVSSPPQSVPASQSFISSPPQNIAAPQSFISSPEPAPPPPAESAASDSSLTGDPAVVKTPPVSVSGTASHSLLSNDVPVSKSSSESNGATTNRTNSPAVPQTFPFSVPQPQRSFQMDNVLAQNPPFPGGSSSLGSNTIQPVPIPPSFDSAFSNNHSIMPSLSNSMSDYSNQRFSHPHLHMPFPHPIRDSQSMMNVHYPGYSKSLTEARPNARSPCMYGPTLPAFPSAMSAISGMPFDRGQLSTSSSLDTIDKPSNGTTYLPNNTDIFRQYPSLPAPSPAYGYSSAHSHFTTPHSFPHSGYPPASTYSGYSSFGMPPPPSLPIPPAIPGNSSHLGPYSASSALSSLNQTHGCPKNGQHPPASLTLVTHQTQASYGCINNSRDSVPNSDDSNQSIVKDNFSQFPLAVVMETSEKTKLAIQQEGVFISMSAINESTGEKSSEHLFTVINEKVKGCNASLQPRLTNTYTMTSETTEQIWESESHIHSNSKVISHVPPLSTECMESSVIGRNRKINITGTESVACGDEKQLKTIPYHGANTQDSCRIPRKILSTDIFSADRADGMEELRTMTISEHSNTLEAYSDLSSTMLSYRKSIQGEGEGGLERDSSGSPKHVKINTKSKNREEEIVAASYSEKTGIEVKVHHEKDEECDRNQGQKVTVMDTEGDAVIVRHEE